MKSLLLFLAGIVVAAVAAYVAAASVIRTGTYSVAATQPHSDWVSHSLELLMVSSVKEQARDVVVPASFNLRDRAFAAGAVGHFDAMCATCHGAPGREEDEWAGGLYPDPPDLKKALQEHHWTDTQLYWIIKHGIKDSGMPAFGPSHHDEDIWALAALVQQLPDITTDWYRTQASRAGAHEQKGEGGHAPEEHAESAGT